MYEIKDVAYANWAFVDYPIDLSIRENPPVVEKKDA